MEGGRKADLNLAEVWLVFMVFLGMILLIRLDQIQAFQLLQLLEMQAKITLLSFADAVCIMAREPIFRHSSLADLYFFPPVLSQVLTYVWRARIQV